MGRKGFIALLIGLGIFAALLWQLDFFSHWKELGNINLFWLAASLAIMTLHQFSAYLKWKVMYDATGAQQPLLPVYASVLVGGMVTPARSGDVIASLGWKGIQGKVLACAIFNRISEGVMTIILSLFILGLFFQSAVANLKWFFIAGVFSLVTLMVIFVFNRSWGMAFFHAFRKILQKFKERALIAKLLNYEKKIEDQIEFFYETMDQFRKKHALTKLVLFTFWNRSLVIFMNTAMLQALGVTLPWTKVLGILAATWVSMFLSPVPGGFGVGDVAPGLMLVSFGYKSQAGNFIVINHILDFVIIFLWTAVWMKTVKAAAAAEKNPA